MVKPEWNDGELRALRGYFDAVKGNRLPLNKLTDAIRLKWKGQYD